MTAEFLDVVWPNNALLYGEIRTIRDGRVTQRFFPLGADRGAVAFAYAADMGARGNDVYFGVLPRTSQGGKAADVHPWTDWLWGDVDAKKHSDTTNAGKAMALTAVNHLPIAPHILVDSGHGYHTYHRLHMPERLDRAQLVMRWIADQVQGDRVMDGPRVLRLPGTLNRKRAVPVPCRLLRLDYRQARLSDFESYLPIARELLLPHETSWPRARREWPAWLDDLLDSRPPRGSRSEQIFRATVWLLRYGRSAEEVKAIIRNANLGEKYREKSSFDGERYLGSVLAAAERVA